MTEKEKLLKLIESIDPEAVEHDVVNGYVSLEKAREDYGVAIDPKTLKLDVQATEKLRTSRKG